MRDCKSFTGWGNQVNHHVIYCLSARGDDDFFSTDMSVEERRSKAPKLHIPIALVFGGSDEYFPYPDRLPDLIASMREAWPEIFLAEIIEGADHGYTQEGRTRDALWRVLQTIFTKLFN